MEENTLAVFMADNGGIDSKIKPRGDGSDNGPFLGGKACLTEGGIRLPLIVRWKGKIKEVQWVDIPIDYTDIHLTILEGAGYDSKTIAQTNSLDRERIKPLITDCENVQNSYPKKTCY
ncbi:alkaline phosphatase family protein [Maribacter antarcticus]|uniref:sulfatase-like hydrolase/transferase n=1 Tax=Maribacter antarcticus TaxID=505250 RepID=UPI000479DAFC|nr:sulfatase-like hydrolase/transferase [Maribacter antarcticus]